MYSRQDRLSLPDEARVYRNIGTCPSIPQVRWEGQDHGYHAVVQTAMGPTLWSLLSFCGGTFLMSTVLLLLDQLIPRLQEIHRRGYVHNDIKPANIALGTGQKGTQVFFLDLGHARRWRNANTGEHVPREAPNAPGNGTGPASRKGTPMYCAANANLGRSRTSPPRAAVGSVLIGMQQPLAAMTWYPHPLQCSELAGS